MRRFLNESAEMRKMLGAQMLVDVSLLSSGSSMIDSETSLEGLFGVSLYMLMEA